MGHNCGLEWTEFLTVFKEKEYEDVNTLWVCFEMSRMYIVISTVVRTGCKCSKLKKENSHSWWKIGETAGVDGIKAKPLECKDKGNDR